jgi:hypothetical protein
MTTSKTGTKTAAKPETTKADSIWEKIKDQPIEMFALPGQTVSMHCKRVNIDPNEVHLILKSTAALPALEGVLRGVKLGDNEMFDISQAAHYTVVKIVPKVPVPIG